MPDEPLLIGMDWESAISQARAGKVALLAWKVSESPIPEQHWKSVADIIAKPPQETVRERRLPRDYCQLIRQVHAEVRANYKAKKNSRPSENAYRNLSERLGISVGTLRDVVEFKKTYATDRNGE